MFPLHTTDISNLTTAPKWPRFCHILNEIQRRKHTRWTTITSTPFIRLDVVVLWHDL